MDFLYRQINYHFLSTLFGVKKVISVINHSKLTYRIKTFYFTLSIKNKKIKLTSTLPLF